MKQLLLLTVMTMISGVMFAQTQIGNGDMEAWANNDEPDNWNSFLTAGGQWSGFASDQCDASTDVRPGSCGTASCQIWSKSVLGVVANGNVTLGKINMGSTTPTDPANYNYTVTGDADFSEAMPDTPDSIVFWAKFTPNGGNGNARMKATIHTDYDYRDPEDAGSSNEVVATAVVNYPSTNGSWQRFSVPFDYSGPAAVGTQAYILVTFTTNEQPGGGNDGDEVLIDDVQLIYNSIPVDTDGDGVLDATEVADGTSPCDLCSYLEASVTETPSAAWNTADCDNDGVANANDAQPLVGIEAINNSEIVVSMDNMNNVILISGAEDLNVTYVVYNAMGQVVQTGNVENQVAFTAKPGVYFVHIGNDANVYKFEILKQ